MSSEKTSWPEVVGWPAAAAVTQINSDRPDVAIEVVPDGTNVPPGYNALRVRVYFDAANASGPVLYTPVLDHRISSAEASSYTVGAV
uniref:Uncharacterized protein n=1 Tax=Zea mays TaxID=4577 RepID=A0A804PE82_MAIZE